MSLEELDGDCNRCSTPIRVYRVNGVVISSMCQECTDLFDATQEALRRAHQVEEQAARTKAWRAASGVPLHLWDFTFDSVVASPELTEALALAKAWANGEVHGAVLSGDVGVGKTRLAIAAANQMLERRKVHFMSGPLLMARLGTGSFDSPVRTQLMEALTGSSALILDDLDKARPSSWAAEAIFVAIDQRADGAAPLLVTTNMSSQEFQDHWPGVYGEAMASRLMLLEGVKVQGADRRRA